MCWMPKKKLPLDVHGEADAVLAQLSIHREPSWQRDRLRAVKLGLEGELELEEIATAVGRARSTIQNWFNRYRSEGVAGLLTKGKGNGPEPKVSPEVAAQLRTKLEEGKWRTAEEARRWLAQEHKIEIKGNHIYIVLKKLGGA